MDVSDKKDLCSPCAFKDKTKEAAKWCIDCKEPLCVSCYEHHNVHRSSRSHHVISVESNQMLESLQKRHNEYCEGHDQEKDLYCSTHSEFICLTCTYTSHRKCEPAVRLSDVTKNAKMSPFVSVLENNIIDIMEELEDIIKDRENNKLEIEQQKIEILDTVKDVRKCIDAQLDQVENKITEDLKAKLEKYNMEIDKTIKFLTDHLNGFKKIHEKMHVLKEYASDTQTFIGARDLDKDLHSEEVRVTSFLEKIQSITIAIEKNPEIFATCGKIKSFGNIQVETLNKGYCIFKKIKGQYPIDIQSKTISKFSKALEIKIPPRSIIDNCAILPSKQMIFVDSQARNKRLIIFNEDGTHDRNIKLSSRPFDIAVIGNDKLALSFPWSTRKRIEMINTTNNRSEHEIFFKNKCFGISYDKGRLFVIVKNEGILIMDLCGQLWSSLPIEGKGIFYIHVKNDRLYCSDNCNDTVQCYDMKGCALWKHKHSNLRSPMSISSNENHIFIAGCKSNNIVSTNLNGNIAKVICNKNHGIKNPTSVYFEKHLLLMCNGKNAQAFLYKEN
ncbi:uncharacterized protein LOC127720149 isoform X2 [Mytilus californianus]|uniref:uncharacterized protein LOC127720149 isoform X2 n=1 Tax=Mytilus californianus TaxID=6549 RepID=UPI002246640A|nr:uncharacterized protein LOC127720149 isoform X2 [Mytilus californianus]XP_052082577.1 uncharacterized protein LOC127720149 isoform X2 [Mytilus californianus]